MAIFPSPSPHFFPRRGDPARYRALAASADEAGLMEALTDAAVEDRVVERVRRKAAAHAGLGPSIDRSGDEADGPAGPAASTSGGGGAGEAGEGGEGGGQNPPAPGVRREASPDAIGGLDPDAVADLYRRWVMPMTKEVQVAYLLRRGDPAPGFD